MLLFCYSDECPSANLVHYITEYYEEIPTNQHSSVRLILNEKMNEFELPPMDEKVPLSEDCGPEPQKVFSEEDMASLDPMLTQNPTCFTNTVQEEEAVEPTPETSSFITVEEEITREDLNMEDGEHPPEEEQLRGRNADKSKRRKRTCRALSKMCKYLYY